MSTDEEKQHLSKEEASLRQQTRLGQLRLLMWKNMILRRRHWVLTLLELGIPAGLMCLVIFLRTIPDSKILPEEHKEVSVFEPVGEYQLRSHLCLRSLGIWFNGECFLADQDLLPGDRKLFWGPSTPFTQAMIDIVKDEIFFTDEYLKNVSSTEEMDDLVDVSYLESNDSLSAFYIGIFFNLEEGEEETNPPNHLNYDLRLQKVWLTDYVYPFIQLPGPRNFTDEDSTLASYNIDGFTLLQTIVDRAFMKIVSGNNDVQSSVKLETQMYPYPPYIQDHGLSQFFGSLLPTFVVFSLVLLSPILIKSIVYEKETGVRELVKMMGMDSWLIWLGWFFYSFITIFIVCIIIMALLKIEMVAKDGSGLVIPPVLVYSDGSLLFVILLVYGVSAICFCFAISCFFSKPTLATTVGVLLWLLTYFIPRALIDYRYEYLGLGAKLSSCLLPNMAMTLAFRVIAMFEGRALGVHWDNLWETGNTRDQLTIGMIIIMMVVDIIFYTFITWYVDQVMPGVYGVPKPVLFLFQKSYWSRGSPASFTAGEDDSKDSAAGEYTEPEPEGLVPGIVIRGLRKEFKTTMNTKKVAVEDVTFSCYKGQCTVLLGHNGAGKTTTMSILTGIYAPTKGYAEVNGWNISTHLKQAREQVGLCPQHNTLFTDLSVQQHLMFFARLKGLTPKEAKHEAAVLLGRLKLDDKRNHFGGQLSGGMKRKLCLAIALIGGSNIIILDEPSSGLDPESRRWVWNVIQKERGSRTVLVTTHHMEEADVLGDRVAIMANGRVVCSGSSLFLKNKFGDGYTLSIAGQRGTDLSRVTTLILKHFEDASLRGVNGFHYEFKIPPRTESFPALLTELTHEKETLKINHIGLSLTTMEQVFLRVGSLGKDAGLEDEGSPAAAEEEGEEALRKKGRHNESFDPETDQDLPLSTGNDDAPKDAIYRDQKLKGFALWFQRFRALWKKKFIYSRRKWLLLITQALIPVLVTTLCLGVDSTFNEQDFKEQPVQLSLEMFDYTYSSIECHDGLDGLCHNYRDLFYDSFKVDDTTNVTKTLLEAADQDLNVYRENYVTSGVFHRQSSDNIHTRMMYQSIPYHAPGIGINLIDNALLHLLVGTNYSITTNNAPLPLNKEWQIDDDQTTYSAALYSITMPLALSFLTSSFLVFPLEERVSNSKQIQLMTGTPARLLWFTMFVWDFLSYLVSALLIFICFMLFDSKEYFTVNGAPGALFALLFFYGIGSIPVAYVFSFPFLSAASGFAVLAFVNIIAGIILSTVTLSLDVLGKDNLIHIADILGNISSLIPSYPASKGFLNIVDLSNYNKICSVVEVSLRDQLCHDLGSYGINSSYLICCPDLCEDYGQCFVEMSYLRWEYPGIGMHLMFLVVDFLLFFVVLFFIEVGAGDLISINVWKLMRKIWKLDVSSESAAEEEQDEDVVKEKEIAYQLFAEENQAETAIVVKDLSKMFIKAGTVAVKSLSFHVRKGECFGLLGVNGAGKTTTFRMLTGDEVRTSGDARIGSNFLSHGRKRFMEEIGYCPQFDAIIGELTGEEMLSLMAGLRGVAKRKQPQLLQRLINLVDLTECAKRPSSTYSGGNKRKLSTAMALVGQPPLVFLDEPTSGVDPASRRRVWEAIRDSTRCGQSVILTSHSMDECEALCSDVVIMAKGVLKCAGTPKHLKAKFGRGYTLQVKITSSLPKDLLHAESPREDDEDLYTNLTSELKENLLKTFPDAVLSDEHRGMLMYRVPASTSWSSLFTKMEKLKAERERLRSQIANLQGENPLFPLLLEDYAAMDPSLEQVFLSFAREDAPPHNSKIQETKF